MNLSEFKAWFEGFTENLDGPPGEKAWKKIQAKVKEIRDTPPTTYPVFVDRYIRERPWWGYYTTTCGVGQATAAVGSNTAYEAKLQSVASPDLMAWNNADAFRTLGAADAQALSN